MLEPLNSETFLLFAVRSYTSPHFVEQEFFSDLKRLKYVKRLIQKYKYKNELRLRLILNHIIMLYNVFDTESCTRLLFYKIHENEHDILKTVLVFLGFMPQVIKDVNGRDILSHDISINKEIQQELDKL